MGPLSLTGACLFNNSKSDIQREPFEIRSQQASLRAGFHGGRFKASAGYTYLSARRDGLRTVSYLPLAMGAGGTFLWNVFYEGKANILDADLSLELNRTWKVGGWVSVYSNAGSYDNRRTMIKAFVEYAFNGGYTAQAGYRLAEFKEPVLGFNNYRAGIFEFSFGYRWQ